MVYFLLAVIAILIAFAKIGFGRIFAFVSLVSMLSPYLARFMHHYKSQNNNHGQGSNGGGAIRKSAMTIKEAAEILEVSENATKAEIKAAHNRLITKIHPDKGGSAYLAARVNEARDVLLKSP